MKLNNTIKNNKNLLLNSRLITFLSKIVLWQICAFRKVKGGKEAERRGSAFAVRKKK
ncbi:hypothetical protein WG904_13415 [Pedobacter sp. Du54]|uniref:hypothetical protein n=1 Tax=Pedobacter anseongensis TaxID=3133439 RepID=UPI0030B75BA1